MVGHDLEDAMQLTDPRIAFTCARLHLRTGKRRLQKGLRMEGMLALYDSVIFGMRYYVTEHRQCLSVVENIDLWDAASLFQALARAGVFDDPLAFNRFSLIVERALWQKKLSPKSASILADVEKILRRLGIIPLNESALGNGTSSWIDGPVS